MVRWSQKSTLQIGSHSVPPFLHAHGHDQQTDHTTLCVRTGCILMLHPTNPHALGQLLHESAAAAMFLLAVYNRLHLRCDYFLRLSGKITRISPCSVVYAVVHSDTHINVGSLNLHVSQIGISFSLCISFRLFIFLCIYVLAQITSVFCHLILFSFR